MRVGDQTWQTLLSGEGSKVDVDGVMMAADSQGELKPITKEFIESKFKAKIDLACDFKPIKLHDNQHDQKFSIDSQDFRSHAQELLQNSDSHQSENNPKQLTQESTEDKTDAEIISSDPELTVKNEEKHNYVNEDDEDSSEEENFDNMRNKAKGLDNNSNKTKGGNSKKIKKEKEQ